MNAHAHFFRSLVQRGASVSAALLTWIATQQVAARMQPIGPEPAAPIEIDGRTAWTAPTVRSGGPRPAPAPVRPQPSPPVQGDLQSHGDRTEETVRREKKKQRLPARDDAATARLALAAPAGSDVPASTTAQPAPATSPEPTPTAAPSRTDEPSLDAWQPVPSTPAPAAPTAAPDATPTAAPELTPPFATLPTGAPAPVAALPGPAPAPAAPTPAPTPVQTLTAPGWAAPLPTAATSATDPTMACPFGRCRWRQQGGGLPRLRRDFGWGTLSLNLYADVGYAFGPQKKHKYLDYISGEVVEDFGRRDYTSYPLYVNQLSLAYAYVQGQYELPQKLRLRFSLHTGHIVESLYFEEKKSLQLIREAALYYYFIPQLAVEAGIFPSYYGAEIVLNKENIHATRAYIADFTPDYEAGIRLHYHFRKDMTLRLMVLNGWQEIRDANGRKGYGLVWSIYKPGKIVGDWTVYWGNEALAGSKQALYRHYHNLYYRIWLGKRWLIFPMFDFIVQTDTPGSNTAGKYQFVVSPAFSIRYGITDRVGFALRYDYLYNKSDIVPELKTGTPNGWQSHSGTATLEYLPLPQLTFRLEGRYGTNKDAVFRNGFNRLVREDWYVILSAAFHI